MMIFITQLMIEFKNKRTKNEGCQLHTTNPNHQFYVTWEPKRFTPTKNKHGKMGSYQLDDAPKSLVEIHRKSIHWKIGWI